ncbi:monovalent cation/H+ antiporter subunit D family protein [Magnetovirga frankeli]|uniref:monovalent cation/H+ antiporter subunit D family protein n=1 Tax=Magnetovirga frankeli TaxID=947516 RepID=UPI001293568D|nr:monovalent cation/H+ antiporter subunit D family protein [gamma proteobacterium SS-5]
MMQHLPVLQVIVPLLAAPLALLLRPSRLAWLFALIASGAGLFISLSLLAQVLEQGTLIYALGGWAAPIGIEYRIDRLNAFVLLLVSLIGFVVLLAADTSIRREIDEDKQPYFYSLYLLCMAGLLGIVATGDAFNVFVFLEISALSTYTLIAMGRDRRALWASYQYLIMGTIGATFILIGIGLLYMMTGTLNMHDLALRLPAVQNSATVLTATAFFVVGVCLKLALFPMHLWLPNAYAYAPSIVTALLAATATKVAIYVLIRFVFTIFGLDFAFDSLPVHEMLLVLGVVGILVASVLAIAQSNVKRLFAYSSVAQIGYMVLGIGLANTTGLTASLLHLFNHALMKGALFLALAGVFYRLSTVELKSFQGLGRQMPLTLAAIVIGGLSLVGVPLTVGFVSKWYLVLAILERGWWPLAFLVMLGSLLALVYLWRIVEMAYFSPAPADGGNPPVKEAPLMILLPTWLLVIANVYFGLDTDLTVSLASLASIELFTPVVP